MAIEAKEIVPCIRGALLQSIRLSYRCARDHPSVPAVLLLLFTLYTSFPSLFSFIVSSSPVVLCTTLLLGLLLSYGEPHLPETQHDSKTRGISSLKVGTAQDDLVVENDASAVVEARVEESSSSIDEEEEEEEREIRNEEETAVEREAHHVGFVEEGGFSTEKRAEGAVEVGEDVCDVSTGDQMESKGLKVEIAKPALFDSSLGSPWYPIDIHDAASYSETDGAESSSTDASMADIIPMLEELHPLLASEAHQLALESTDAAASRDRESDDGSAEGRAERQEDEEDAGGQGEKDGGNGEAVMWTAEDQKNLMDLGTSELERNRRLENLIAKRRARKNLRFEAEKNLIDFDSTMEELYNFHVQIPPISATRRNPFDLPCDLEEIMGLPPVPSSAPSVMLHGRNPFDLPSEQVDQSRSLTGESLIHQEFVSVPQRDIFFEGHEGLAPRASFSGELKQEMHDDMLTGFTNLQRQSSEKGDSKVSSVSEFDTTSSLLDQKNHEELLEEEIQEAAELSSPSNHNAEAIEQESQSSLQADSSNVDHVDSEINVADDRSIDLISPLATEETHQTTDPFQAAEDENREFDISDAAKLEVTEIMHDEPSSSSLLELNEKSRAGEQVDDTQGDGSVYDSDPSAIGASLSNISTLDEALFHEDEGGLNSTGSLSFGTQGDISEMGSPPKPIEKDISSGESVDETTDEDSVSASERVWVASPNSPSLDDGESNSRERAEFTEHDVVQVELSGLREDLVNPIAHSSTAKSAIQSSDEGDLEKSQVSILNLPPIPEENLEDYKLEEEHESMIDPAGIVDSTGLQSLDFGFWDTEHELSYHEPGNDDDSLISPIISSRDSGFAGLRLFELRESMETSSLLDSKCEIEIKPDDISSDSPGYNLKEIQSEQEGFFSKMSDDSVEEPNEIHAEVGSMEEIDEGLLSELDVVGDFRAAELKSEQGDPEMELESDGHFVDNSQFPTQLHVSKAMLPSEANLNAFDELHSVMNKPYAMESEVGSSLRPFGEDPEMTVYNPKLHVLEAGSFEELDSAFKRLHEETVLISEPESIFGKSVTEKIEVGSGESNIADGDPKLSETDSELQVLEAKSIEDINSAFKQLSKVGHDDSFFPEVEPSEHIATDLEPIGGLSDLHIVEANSLEDIRSALKLFSDGSAESLPKSLESGEGSSVVEASEREVEPEVLEVQSAEEIRLAFAAAAARETGSSH